MFFFVNPAQSDGSRLLVVLLLKVHRVLRHGEFFPPNLSHGYRESHVSSSPARRSSLCFVKRRVKCQHSMSSITASCRCQVRSPVTSPRSALKTRLFTLYSLVRRQIHSRRSFHILRSPKHGRTHRDVLLLPVRRHGPAIPEVLVVEEISDGAPNGSLDTPIIATRTNRR